MNGKEFFKLCEEEFSYLQEDFNFEIVKKEKNKWG